MPRRAQPIERALGDPIRVVQLAGNGVVRDLRGAGVAAAFAGQYRGEPGNVLGVLSADEVRVMVTADGTMGGELEVLEAMPAPRVWPSRKLVFGVSQRRIQMRIEVGLPDQRRAVARSRQLFRHAWRVVGQANSVGDDAVGARVLSSEHRRARWHAHDVVHVRTAVVDARPTEPINHRGPRDLSAVGAERVEALLVHRDEQDVVPGRRRAAARRG